MNKKTLVAILLVLLIGSISFLFFSYSRYNAMNNKKTSLVVKDEKLKASLQNQNSTIDKNTKAGDTVEIFSLYTNDKSGYSLSYPKTLVEYDAKNINALLATEDLRGESKKTIDDIITRGLNDSIVGFIAKGEDGEKNIIHYALIEFVGFSSYDDFLSKNAKDITDNSVKESVLQKEVLVGLNKLKGKEISSKQIMMPLSTSLATFFQYNGKIYKFVGTIPLNDDKYLEMYYNILSSISFK